MEIAFTLMKRIQLFEFEDFNWFPTNIRSYMTNLIVQLQRKLGIGEVLANLIAEILKDKNISQIVDVGSGSGGVMPDVIKMIHEVHGLSGIKLLMTDLYPNPEMVKKYKTQNDESISYHDISVDATNIATAPTGLKTMVNSFHHMPPKEARNILVSAQENRQPLLIYEMGENNIPLLIWWLLLPISLIVVIIMVLFMTPSVKPLTWQQIVFTYLIPIIPVCFAWDGQASLPRMYTFKDLDVLLDGLGTSNYIWKKGRAKKSNGKKQGTYLMGVPV
ncbi:hypothetical protein SAMN04488514_102364 [Kriegella aquimaris]|uniref:Methyltransferase domain-containing protein n=2 Tax=Kriegella aquimaris TaxID=192904 RepID=A0A1G9M537_9FLAO|nr:hypothetical protein SAMN04488514_102364 [Kriegella aquimaris]